MTNSEQWIAVAAIVGILIQIGTAIFVYGKLTEKVKGHDQSIIELKKVDDQQWDKLEQHSAKLGDHGERLSKVETLIQKKHGASA